ncbi:hypothetical protein [Empedobacter tilapiae]|nr:hypothetical protein [Empedobacter tilapiae]
MRKELQNVGPKKSTVDKLLAFSKSLSSVKVKKMGSQLNINLN